MTEVKKSTKKRKPPDPKPEALCFDLKGSSPDHTDVLNGVRKITNLFRGTSIKFVQFLPREHRWVITMDSMQSRDRMAGSYVTINDTEVQLRRYDDIAKLEYRKYIRANGLIEMVNSIP
ncbi:hypothetical protein FSP39_015633 [Pinctada imbricata]|uniref:Uncharacterized protein n=1 Tax=Pinctada imbricata TaxID=66713 RepID=A0AA89BVU2_PINIB|nr:hypothetical protein FSP39_015633 [Pinctada imbricata]